MADCTGLENRHVREGIVGSNPTLSALISNIPQATFEYRSLINLSSAASPVDFEAPERDRPSQSLFLRHGRLPSR